MDVTIKLGDAAHLRILVMRERVIVMDLVMEGVMMDMMGAKEILSVEATIARSLDYSTTKRMTVVRDPPPQYQEHQLAPYHVLVLL